MEFRIPGFRAFLLNSCTYQYKMSEVFCFRNLSEIAQENVMLIQEQTIPLYCADNWDPPFNLIHE